MSQYIRRQATPQLSRLVNGKAAQAVRVAVTGHQQLGDAENIAFVQRSFGAQLAELRDNHPEGLVALSGLAAGADTLFAKLAVRGGIPLEVCLAAEDITENFAPGLERDDFLTLCAMSQRIHRLGYLERSNTAYMALGRWLVAECDLLVAAWNGLPAAGEGGTGDVVDYALRLGRPVVHIHTLDQTVRTLP